MAPRVLFVDQSALIQKMAAQAFAQEKIEVIKVGSGDLATWLINQINPDLVIADVSVPDKSGYELCQYIKNDERLSHIPVVLLYWPDETFDYAKADGARADAYLTKPFETQALIETAQRLLGQERSFSSPPAPPLPDLGGSPVEKDGPLDISDLFDESAFDIYSRAKISEIEFPLVIEDLPATSVDAVEPATGEKPPLAITIPASDKEPAAVLNSRPYEQAPTLTTNDPEYITQRRTRSGLMAVALAVLMLALILGLWRATRIHETEQSVSPVVSAPQSEPQPQADSTARTEAQPIHSPQKESPQRDTLSFIDNRRSQNPTASGFTAQKSSTANRSEPRQANNTYAVESTASRPPQSTQPGSNQSSATPAKSNRIEQSPPQNISGNATSPSIPKAVKSGSASQQPMETQYGIRQAGGEVKGAFVWAGKKAARGIKAIGRGLKKVFRRDSKID